MSHQGDDARSTKPVRIPSVPPRTGAQPVVEPDGDPEDRAGKSGEDPGR